MKISSIIEWLKILVATSEQVAEIIEASSIPPEEQNAVRNSVSTALEKLNYANSKVDVEPTCNS
ncbi:hypothetical protein Riv7116_2112 [Rivularia sp. PCC 7116]|uniref:hypothetical protein n=1 Tax=Rivularia sp. PCC 7116 TaxID=373994 RepID=UPI00029F020F|nr:hypothetical protein [Rivularia sp. PCC 7116]AFY54643.1 hypothetical protein Riv7116_2112 [Rivularia sp. PCC 7116]